MKNRNRRILVIGFMVIVFSTIIIRFFNLQILNYEKFKDRAFNKVVRTIPISAPRGLILDRNGLIIVDNAKSYDLQLVPYDVKDFFNYELLSEYVEIDTSNLKSKIYSFKKSFNRKFTPILLKKKIDQNTIFQIREQREEFPGLVIREVYIRDYVHNSNINLAHVLSEVKIHSKSYPNPKFDKISLVPEGGGVEKVYNLDLEGSPGKEYHLFDAAGMDRGIYSGNLYKNIKPLSGNDIKLTIDINLQEYIYNIMQNFEGKSYDGTIICSVPESGEILAYVNSPTFDIRKMLMGISQTELDSIYNLNSAFFNRGINPYLSGSIMKIPSTIMLLEEGFDRNTKYDCNGRYITSRRDTLDSNSKDRFISCHSNHLDSVSLAEALSESCNIYFWKSVKEFYSIYKPKWSFWMENLGFSKPTGIDLLYEKKALLEAPRAKSQMINKVIGQGESKVTPIQVIQMINIIANDGKLIRPRLSFNASKSQIETNIKKKNLKFIQNAMKEAVISGTAKKSRIENAVIRAKTGTAELKSKYIEGEKQDYHAWFAGYMSFMNKNVSIVIFLEKGGKGGNAPAKMANKIFEKIKSENMYE